tara:strand:+ start:11834 stop:14179 length:2346 start_codon:yes stop_codon:yes gene_type:complete
MPIEIYNNNIIINDESLYINFYSILDFIKFKGDYNGVEYDAQWTYSNTDTSVYHLGNVGIGTYADTSISLTIVGDVNISGDIFINDEKISLPKNYYSIYDNKPIASKITDNTVITPTYLYSKNIAEVETGLNGWRLVRFLPETSSTWFSIGDSLVGNISLNEGTKLSTEEWSIPFGIFDQYCFSTMNMLHWVYCNKDQIISESLSVGVLSPVTILGGSIRNFPHIREWLIPTITSENYSSGAVLYSENPSENKTLNMTPGGSGNGGMCVWVRNSSDTEIYGDGNGLYESISFPYIENNNYPQYNLNFPEETICDILVVGGGGSGGKGSDNFYQNDTFILGGGGGGGGAGGLIFQQNVLLNGNYDITIGDGGIGDFDGDNSSIGSLYLALGGGKGADFAQAAPSLGNNGGSGGGGAGPMFGTGSFPGGTGNVDQGNDGGYGYTGNGTEGGGGGGAGFAGNNAELSSLDDGNKTGEKGGDGLSGKNGIDFKTHFNITDTNIGHHVGNLVYFAGGGGGGGFISSPFFSGSKIGTTIGKRGEGGLGGGGFKLTYRPTDGYGALPNSGGGGGGTYDKGGSGIIIIRYKLGNNYYKKGLSSWIYSKYTQGTDTNDVVSYMGNVGIGSFSGLYQEFNEIEGSTQQLVVDVSGHISATSKNFKINHPIVNDMYLYHSCIEGPRFDNIYRGKKLTVNGYCEVNIDTECNSTGGMTLGTFISLNTNYQLYLQNNQTFDKVKGYIEDGKIKINSLNTTDDILVDWLVIGERRDKDIINNNLTNSTGQLICEH